MQGPFFFLNARNKSAPDPISSFPSGTLFLIVIIRPLLYIRSFMMPENRNDNIAGEL